MLLHQVVEDLALATASCKQDAVEGTTLQVCGKRQANQCSLSAVLEGYRTLLVPLRTLLDAINLALYMWCGQYHSKSQQHDTAHISTSVWRSLFFYVH